MDSLWKLWLGAGVLVAIVHVATVDGPDARLLTFLAVGIASCAVVLTSVIRLRPQQPLPWVLGALGMLSFVLGDLAYRWLESANEFPPFPSIADVFYLMSYPLLGFAIVGVGYRAGNARHGAALAGAFAVGLVASMRVWMAFVDDTFGYGMTSSALVVALAYPALSIGVLMAASYVLLAANGAPVRTVLLAAAGLSMFVADMFYNVALNNGSFAVGGAEDFFWLLSYVLVGAGAMAPVAAGTSEARPWAETTSHRDQPVPATA